MSKFWKKLDNPFLLVIEGFVAGALLFWATAPESADAMQETPVSAQSAISEL